MHLQCLVEVYRVGKIDNLIVQKAFKAIAWSRSLFFYWL